MLWRDLILTGGSLFFIIALIPAVFSKDKPPLFTSVMTGIILIIFSFVYASLSFWFSTATTLATGILWLVLAIQKFRARKL